FVQHLLQKGAWIPLARHAAVLQIVPPDAAVVDDTRGAWIEPADQFVDEPRHLEILLVAPAEAVSEVPIVHLIDGLPGADPPTISTDHRLNPPTDRLLLAVVG